MPRQRRITEEQIAEIERRRGEGEGLVRIATALGLKRTTVGYWFYRQCDQRQKPKAGPKPVIGPTLASSDFIKPPSMARLMAGR